MLAKPNQTVLEGCVSAIRPASGGLGMEVDLKVERNLSSALDEDFLRPAKGSVLALFASEAPAAKVGQRVRIHARLLAGPFGGRVILEGLEPLADEKTASH